MILSSVTVGTASATLASGRFRAANLRRRVSFMPPSSCGKAAESPSSAHLRATLPRPEHTGMTVNDPTQRQLGRSESNVDYFDQMTWPFQCKPLGEFYFMEKER
jgi:hypothetical protein